ncbi:MAG: hypothetical protein JSV79_08125, partial [Armatimonadota bacterium]
NRWVVRGASTGISSIIAPDGRVVAEAGLFERKWISADVRLASEKLRAERQEAGLGWGLVFSWAMFYLSIAFVIVSAVGPGGRREPAVRPPAGRQRRGRAAPR